MNVPIDQVWQVCGALLLLAGYVAGQVGWLPPDSLAYLVLNAAGSGILAVLAWLGRDWGFLLLEAVWGLVAMAGIVRLALSRGAKPGNP
jgi:hypothetical protein